MKVRVIRLHATKELKFLPGRTHSETITTGSGQYTARSEGVFTRRGLFRDKKYVVVMEGQPRALEYMDAEHGFTQAEISDRLLEANYNEKHSIAMLRPGLPIWFYIILMMGVILLVALGLLFQAYQG